MMIVTAGMEGSAVRDAGRHRTMVIEQVWIGAGMMAGAIHHMTQTARNTIATAIAAIIPSMAAKKHTGKRTAPLSVGVMIRAIAGLPAAAAIELRPRVKIKIKS